MGSFPSMSFNSTLVQLKVSILVVLSVRYEQFQFYLSSIKRITSNFIYICREKFQFYLSSIKRWESNPYVFVYELFQFYLSSIKR